MRSSLDVAVEDLRPSSSLFFAVVQSGGALSLSDCKVSNLNKKVTISPHFRPCLFKAPFSSSF